MEISKRTEETFSTYDRMEKHSKHGTNTAMTIKSPTKIHFAMSFTGLTFHPFRFL